MKRNFVTLITTMMEYLPFNKHVHKLKCLSIPENFRLLQSYNVVKIIVHKI